MRTSLREEKKEIETETEKDRDIKYWTQGGREKGREEKRGREGETEKKRKWVSEEVRESIEGCKEERWRKREKRE